MERDGTRSDRNKVDHIANNCYTADGVTVSDDAVVTVSVAISSTFDSGIDGWTVVGDAQSGSTTPDYHASGGDPDGYVSADDDAAGGTWYWNAPSTFLGKQTGAYGGTLSFDLNQSATDNQFDNDDVVLAGGDHTLVYNFGHYSNHPDTNWTHYSITLDESGGWTLDGTDRAPTRSEFKAVLGNLTKLWIRGEYRSGSDTGGLDTVVMTTTNDDTPNQAPAASFTYSPSSPTVGETVTFDASGSSDSDGTIASYEWDFDGDTVTDVTGQTPTHTFTTVDDHTVTLTVTDDGGQTATTTETITVSATGTGGGVNISETFDTDAGGWTVVDQHGNETTTPIYRASGGNPGGYLEINDTLATGIWSWNAGPAFVGDRSNNYEGTLSFDLKQSATDSQFDWDDVVLVGNRMTLVYDFGDERTHPGTDWTQYEIDLNESAGWTIHNGFRAPTEAEMTAVLGNLTALRIRGEYRLGSDTGGLDNIVMTTGEGTSAVNRPPTASFTYTPSSPIVGETVTVDASASTDADGSISSYEWDFAGRKNASGMRGTLSFSSAGSYEVTLTVTDDTGATDSITRTIIVSADSTGDDQGDRTMQWSRSFGGATSARTDDDYGHAAIETTDGGFLVAGYNAIPIDSNSFTRHGYLVKVDTNGNEAWNRTYGTDTAGGFYSIANAGDGYLLAGTHNGQSAGTGDDGWLLKVDANGDVIWNRTYDDPTNTATGDDRADEQIRAIIPIDDGFVIAGMTSTTGGNYAQGDRSDGWIANVDTDGELVWSRAIDGDGSDHGVALYDVAEATDGGYILAGAYTDGANFLAGDADRQAFVLKTDSTGREEWRATYGDDSTREVANAIELAHGGGYVFAGSASDGWFVKIDADGEQAWSTSFDSVVGLRSNEFYEIQQTADGNYLLAGNAVPDGDDRANGWIVKADTSGGAVWNTSVGDADHNEYGEALVQTSDGEYLIAGWITNAGFGLDDLWAAKVGAAGNETTGDDGSDDQSDDVGSRYDDDSDGTIGLFEVQRGISDWADGGLSIFDVQRLINLWANGTPV